jgi:hypothetical protein
LIRLSAQPDLTVMVMVVKINMPALPAPMPLENQPQNGCF